MLEIDIRITEETMATQSENLSELYLLLIVIKLVILIAIKLIKSCRTVYKQHEHKIIRKHAKNIKKFTTANIQEV